MTDKCPWSCGRRKVLGCVSTVLILTFADTAVLANRYRDNPDRIVNQRVESWASPIGQLQTSRRVYIDGIAGIFKGTGFLISPCYIVTAAHVVSPDSDALLNGEIDPRTDFRMVFRTKDPKSHRLINLIASIDRNLNRQKILYLRSLHPSTNRSSTIDLKDYIFLKLPENACVNATPGFGWFEAAERELTNGDRAIALGYPKSKKKGELHLGAGRIGDVTASGLLRYSGSYKVGESGGPVLVMEKGRLKVGGVILAHFGSNDTQDYRTYSNDNANEVLSLVSILNYLPIKAIITADKVRSGNRNSATLIQKVHELPK